MYKETDTSETGRGLSYNEGQEGGTNKFWRGGPFFEVVFIKIRLDTPEIKILSVALLSQKSDLTHLR